MDPWRLSLRRSVGTALALAATTVIGCSTTADPTTSTTTAAPSTSGATTTTALSGALTRVNGVTAGVCFDGLPDRSQQLVAVLVRPCEEAHVYEAFATPRIRIAGEPAPPGGPVGSGEATTSDTRTSGTAARTTLAEPTTYPGELAVRNDAEAQCVTTFADWMGTAWTLSTYDIRSWWPSASSWARGDRDVLCAAFRLGGGATKGSVAGSRR